MRKLKESALAGALFDYLLIKSEAVSLKKIKEDIGKAPPLAP